MAGSEDLRHPLAFEQVSIATTATSLPLSTTTAAKATYALIRNEGASDLRWRDDAVSPTSSVGMLLKAGETLEYEADALQDIKFICAGAGVSATIDVAYYD